MNTEQSKGYKWNVEYTGNNRLKAVLKYPAYSLFRRYEKPEKRATREFVLNYTLTEKFDGLSQANNFIGCYGMRDR